MIISVRADKESFRTVTFKEGLNVVLAERSEDSTEKDSRNGLGKSSLIEIIHFCLGGEPSKTLKKQELEDWTFFLDIKIRGNEYTIIRSINNKNITRIKGNCSEWVINGEKNENGEYIFKTSDLTKYLGHLIFKIPKESSNVNKYFPTFRSCFSYFARRNGETGGFLSPFNNYKNQKEWDKQVNNSFLLGLDWTFASRWEILKDRKKVISQIKTESESGFLKDITGSIGELEARKVRLREEIEKRDRELKEFNVHPQYKELEDDANKITAHSHELTNSNISDKNLIDYYEKSLEEEEGAAIDKVEKIYKEAGVRIPENITKNLNDVKKFHQDIIINRAEFLKSEIAKLKRNIIRRDEELRKLNTRRSEIFNILNTHKALEEQALIQQQLTSLRGELKDIERKIENYNKFQEGTSSLKIDLEVLQQEARISLSEHSRKKDKAIQLFNKNSEYLYDSPGILSIEISKNGYRFGVDIEREGSHGVGNMKIFCYDLALTQFTMDEGNSLGFLIHDSILFADVDERQFARAIELANKEATEKGFQYICTLNSDTIPHGEFSDNFDIMKYKRITLTDAKEEGGLFGFRFK